MSVDKNGLIVTLSGRVAEVQKGDSFLKTFIALPAADEYSAPAMVAVKSYVSLGEVGQVVQGVRAQIGGYRRSNLVNGQRRTFCDMTLEHCA